MDEYQGNQLRYPVDSVIYLLDNWGLMFKEYDPLYIKVDVRTSNLSTAKEKLSRYNPYNSGFISCSVAGSFSLSPFYWRI